MHIKGTGQARPDLQSRPGQEARPGQARPAQARPAQPGIKKVMFFICQAHCPAQPNTGFDSFLVPPSPMSSFFFVLPNGLDSKSSLFCFSPSLPSSRISSFCPTAGTDPEILNDFNSNSVDDVCKPMRSPPGSATSARP